jgi:hypothetical protein
LGETTVIRAEDWLADYPSLETVYREVEGTAREFPSLSVSAARAFSELALREMADRSAQPRQGKQEQFYEFINRLRNSRVISFKFANLAHDIRETSNPVVHRERSASASDAQKILTKVQELAALFLHEIGEIRTVRSNAQSETFVPAVVAPHPPASENLANRSGDNRYEIAKSAPIKLGQVAGFIAATSAVVAVCAITLPNFPTMPGAITLHPIAGWVWQFLKPLLVLIGVLYAAFLASRAPALRRTANALLIGLLLILSIDWLNTNVLPGRDDYGPSSAQSSPPLNSAQSADTQLPLEPSTTAPESRTSDVNENLATPLPDQHSSKDEASHSILAQGRVTLHEFQALDLESGTNRAPRDKADLSLGTDDGVWDNARLSTMNGAQISDFKNGDSVPQWCKSETFSAASIPAKNVMKDTYACVLTRLGHYGVIHVEGILGQPSSGTMEIELEYVIWQ